MSSLIVNKIKYDSKLDYNYDKKLREIFKFAHGEYEQFYPNFNWWFKNKVVSDFYKGNRILYSIENNCGNIFGISILKKSRNTLTSNKICSILLLKEARELGLGTTLINDFFAELDLNIFNSNLVVTVPEERLFESNCGVQFYRFLNVHGFQLKKVETGKYRLGSREYVFVTRLLGVSYGYKWHNNGSAEICVRNCQRTQAY